MSDSGTNLRVCHLITDLETAGAELMLARLVERLEGGPVSNVVIGLGPEGAVGERIARGGVPVFALGMRSGTAMLPALSRLMRLIRQFRPDVLQTWLYHADLAGLVAGTLARVPNIIWNIRCAELDPRDHPRSMPAMSRALAFLSRWPAAVICNAESGRRAHERLGYVPRRWEIIPNGFDTNAFQPCAGARQWLRHEIAAPDEAKVVGLLARFHPMKDQATFLKAAKLVSAVKPEVHFVAAGRGVDTAPFLSSLVDALSLRGHVHLLPEQNEAPRFLAALDVAVSSSYGEAFPNVVGEAMACGTPCVVTDVGDSAQIVGDAGVVVPPRDPVAIATGILRILDMGEAARDKLGRAARERIVSEFSLGRAAARYEKLYLELAGRPMKSSDKSICAG